MAILLWWMLRLMAVASFNKIKRKKIITPTRFELAHLTIVETSAKSEEELTTLESTALDQLGHSVFVMKLGDTPLYYVYIMWHNLHLVYIIFWSCFHGQNST